MALKQAFAGLTSVVLEAAKHDVESKQFLCVLFMYFSNMRVEAQQFNGSLLFVCLLTSMPLSRPKHRQFVIGGESVGLWSCSARGGPVRAAPCHAARSTRSREHRRRVSPRRRRRLAPGLLYQIQHGRPCGCARLLRGAESAAAVRRQRARCPLLGVAARAARLAGQAAGRHQECRAHLSKVRVIGAFVHVAGLCFVFRKCLIKNIDETEVYDILQASSHHFFLFSFFACLDEAMESNCEEKENWSEFRRSAAETESPHLLFQLSF